MAENKGGGGGGEGAVPAPRGSGEKGAKVVPGCLGVVRLRSAWCERCSGEGAGALRGRGRGARRLRRGAGAWLRRREAPGCGRAASPESFNSVCSRAGSVWS